MVEEYLRYWLEHVVRVERRPKTYQGYEGVVRRYLTPELGKNGSASSAFATSGRSSVLCLGSDHREHRDEHGDAQDDERWRVGQGWILSATCSLALTRRAQVSWSTKWSSLISNIWLAIPRNLMPPPEPPIPHPGCFPADSPAGRSEPPTSGNASKTSTSSRPSTLHRPVPTRHRTPRRPPRPHARHPHRHRRRRRLATRLSRRLDDYAADVARRPAKETS
jgi:hypothetical protein